MVVQSVSLHSVADVNAVWDSRIDPVTFWHLESCRGLDVDSPLGTAHVRQGFWRNG
jgi:hypothetical protein